jgi:transcriptional regulator with XRE-family HTH domain
MNLFKGLPLHNEDVARNLRDIIVVAVTLKNSGHNSQLSDELLDVAIEYARAACNSALMTSTPTNEPLPTNSPASIPASLRTPKPYPEQQTAELPVSLHGEAAAENSVLFAPYDGGIGFRIQLARENLGLTQGQVAKAIGVTPTCVSRWEVEEAEPSWLYLSPLSEALKCDLFWLLGDSKGNEPPVTNEAPLVPFEVMQGVDMAGVGKRIRECRVSRRMTSEELENAANLPEGVLSLWEAGKANPPSDVFDKLAHALNCSVTWLLTGREIAKES